MVVVQVTVVWLYGVAWIVIATSVDDVATNIDGGLLHQLHPPRAGEIRGGGVHALLAALLVGLATMSATPNVITMHASSTWATARRHRNRHRGRHRIRGADGLRLRRRNRHRIHRLSMKHLYRSRLRSVRKGARVAARALPATAGSHSRRECALLGAAMLAIVVLPRLTRLGRIVKSVDLH